MAAFNFAVPQNNLSTTLAAPTSGSGTFNQTFTLTSSVPTVSSPSFYRVTVLKAAFAYVPTVTSANFTIYSATASGTSLTVTGVLEGTSDRAYAIGDVVELRATAGTFSDIQNTINGIENGTDAIGIGNTITGGTNNSVLYVSGSGALADSGPTWDGTKFTANNVNAEGPSSGSVPALTVTSNSTASGQASLLLLNGHDVFTFNTFDSQGVLWILSNNTTGNRQVTFCASEQANSNTNFGFRMTLGHGLPRFDGISTDGSTGGHIVFGQANNLVGMGGLGASSFGQSDIHANVHILAGSTTRVALIAQAVASMTSNIQEWQNSGGTAMSFIRPDGSIGLPAIANASAVNNSLFWDTTASKLTYKDPAGTLHAI